MPMIRSSSSVPWTIRALRVLRYPIREPDYRKRRSHREFLVSLRQLGVNTTDIDQKAVEAARSVYAIIHSYAPVIKPAVFTHSENTLGSRN